MRRCGKSPEFIEKDGNLIGINLPADFCAEHEWGIEDLCRYFEIPKKEIGEEPFGIERRKATISPAEPDRWGKSHLIFEEKKGFAVLSVGYDVWLKKDEVSETSFLDRLKNPSHRMELAPFYDDKDGDFVCGAWSGGSFGIYVKGEENIEKLKQIRDAILNVNVVIMIGGSFLFENPGLVIAIADRIPEDAKKIMEDSDRDRAELYKVADETVIEAKICAGIKSSLNKPFFALSPRWARKDENTKYKVKFWLNPVEQDDNNYGSFTVEELEQWIVGEGPIPKKKRKKNAG